MHVFSVIFYLKRRFIVLKNLNLILLKNSTFTVDEERFHIV